MLIRSTTTQILNSVTHHPIRPQLLNTCGLGIYRSVYFYQQDADSELYDKYLQSSDTSIKKYAVSEKFKYQAYAIPRKGVKVEEIQQKLATEWKNKKLALNIDPSALIGQRRLIMKTHLDQNVYKDVENPDGLFTRINPSVEIATEEVKFDTNNFFCGDPIANQLFEANQQLPQDQLDTLIQETLMKAYEQQPDRIAKRLRQTLNIPEPYLKLLELAIFNQNPIYFCGINEYSFRNLLSKYLSLNEVKELFMISLKYAESESFKEKLTNKMATKFEDRYQMYARELVYLNYFKIIKKIENGEIMKKLNMISKQKDGSPGRTAARWARKNAKESNIVFIGQQYTAQTLQDYIMIKNLESFTLKTSTPKISTKSINSPTRPQKPKPPKSLQNDSQKIQKHSILQTMLGNLWSQPYTLNKFPYLSQDFTKLTPQDKKYVTKLYKDNLTKYTGAKRVFYQSHVSKIDNIDVDSKEFGNIRVDFQEKRKEYEMARENLQKKILDNQKSQDGKTVDKVEEDYKDYQSSYEEDQAQVSKINEQLLKQMQQKAKMQPQQPQKQPLAQSIKPRKPKQRRRAQSPTKPTN